MANTDVYLRFKKMNEQLHADYISIKSYNYNPLNCTRRMLIEWCLFETLMFVAKTYYEHNKKVKDIMCLHLSEFCNKKKYCFEKICVSTVDFTWNKINLNQNKFELLVRSHFLFSRQTESEPGCPKTIILIQRNRQRNSLFKRNNFTKISASERADSVYNFQDGIRQWVYIITT